jgi:hypothetical protein
MAADSGRYYYQTPLSTSYHHIGRRAITLTIPATYGIGAHSSSASVHWTDHTRIPS